MRYGPETSTTKAVTAIAIAMPIPTDTQYIYKLIVKISHHS